MSLVSGRHPTVALAALAFVVLNIGVASAMLGRRRGATLGMVTSASAFMLGVGFALPFLLVGVPIRLGLTWAGRGSLR